MIVDGADNFPTRYLVNDASVWHGIPVVHGSIYRFEGQVTVFKPHDGPCYRCLFPQPPPPELAPSCAEGGVLGVLPGIIGSLQANEALKLLLGTGDPLAGRLLLFDALAHDFHEVVFARPGLPGLRRRADHHRVHRLRRVLRQSAGAVQRMTPVRIPPTLRDEAGGARQVEARGDDRRASCSRTSPSATRRSAPQLFEDGDLAPFVNVYVDGEDVRTLDGLETPVPTARP